MPRYSTSCTHLIVILLTVILAGCGGGGSSSSNGASSSNPAGSTTTSSSTSNGSGGSGGTQPQATTATLVVTQSLAKLAADNQTVPATVQSFRFTGFDSGNKVVFGPQTQPKAASITLTVPVTMISLRIDYLDAAGLTLFVSAIPVTLTAGTTWNITNPPMVTAPGPATSLAFSVQPSNAVAGQAITPAVTVSLLDGQGNPAITSSATVTLVLGLNPSNASLGGSFSQPAVNGIATFSSLIVSQAGSGFTLTAASTGLSGATSNPFSVTIATSPSPSPTSSPSPGASPSPGSSPSPSPSPTPTPAVKLDISQQPPNGKSGMTFPVSVQLLDANNNVATAATNPVTIAISKDPSKTAVLGGTTTVMPVNGVATFNNLTVSQAALGFQLQATASGLTSATTSSFNLAAQAISFGPATGFVQNNDNAGQQNSQGMVVGDFDHDGHLDVAVANPTDGNAGLSIFYGNGSGSFTEQIYHLNNNWTGVGIAMGQFGADPNLPDLVIGSTGGQSIVLLLNQGNRTFTERDITIANIVPSKLCVLDANKDGFQDVAFGDDNAFKVHVLLNSGDNTNFTDQTVTNAFANTFSTLRAADMDNDGKVDLVANVFSANAPCVIMWNTGNNNQLFINDANNSTGLALSGTSRGIGLGDFNNDGLMDVLFVNNNGAPPYGRPYVNNGSRSFSALPDNLITGGSGDTSGGGNTQCGVFADLNLDGAADIVMGDQGPPKNQTLPGIDYFTNTLTGLNAVFSNDQFTASANANGVRAIASGDFNEDTRPDIVTMGSFTKGGIVIYLNTSH